MVLYDPSVTLCITVALGQSSLSHSLLQEGGKIMLAPHTIFISQSDLHCASHVSEIYYKSLWYHTQYLISSYFSGQAKKSKKQTSSKACLIATELTDYKPNKMHFLLLIIMKEVSFGNVLILSSLKYLCVIMPEYVCV